MRGRAFALAMCVVAGLTGRVDAAPVARPAELMAVLTVSGPALAGMRAYMDAIAPGSGARVDVGMFLQLSSVPTAGLDLAKSPVHLLVMQTQGLPGFVVLAKVTDAPKVMAAKIGATPKIAGGWALVGMRSADLDLVSAYAFATLAKAAPPTAPTATLYTKPFLAFASPFLSSVRSSLQGEAKTQTMREAMNAYIDGFQSIAADSDTIEMRLDADADLATLDAAIVPRAGTRFAQFAAAQKPSDFGLLAKLPASQAAVLFAGRLSTGPYRDGMLALTLAMTTAGSGSKGLADAIGAIMKAASGEFAMLARLDKKRGMSAANLFGVDDPKVFEAAVASAIKELGTGRRIDGTGPGETWSAFAKPVVHDGVTLRGYRIKYDAPKNDTEKRAQEMIAPGGRGEGAIAMVDGLGMTAHGGDAALEAAHLIDALRGKSARLTLTKTQTHLVDYARARRDSVLFASDAGSYATAMGLQITDEATFAMTAGFADGSAHIRTLVPAASVRTAIEIATAASAAAIPPTP